MNLNVFLPGGREQIRKFFEETELKDKEVLVIGSGSEALAEAIAEETGRRCELIVEDYDSLMNSRLLLKNNPMVNLRLMEFESTDFADARFDAVYSQGSLCLEKRNKIVKEILRILKPSGILCTGEIVSLTENIPVFIKNLWQSTALSPLYTENMARYYEQKGFTVIIEKDLSRSLRPFYAQGSLKLKDQRDALSEDEKKLHKKLINKISHETNVYLKQGGDKVIGFKMMVLQLKVASASGAVPPEAGKVTS